MGDLSLKVVPLFGTADPAVANKVGVGGFSHKGVNVVPTLSRSRPDCLYPAVICVLSQRIGWDGDRVPGPLCGLGCISYEDTSQDC